MLPQGRLNISFLPTVPTTDRICYVRYSRSSKALHNFVRVTTVSLSFYSRCLFAFRNFQCLKALKMNFLPPCVSWISPLPAKIGRLFSGYQSMVRVDNSRRSPWQLQTPDTRTMYCKHGQKVVVSCNNRRRWDSMDSDPLSSLDYSVVIPKSSTSRGDKSGSCYLSSYISPNEGSQPLLFRLSF